MIKLIKNEFKKASKSKIILSILLLISIIFIIVYLNKNKSINSILYTAYRFIPFIGVLVGIQFGNIVSNELHSGTIRIYLTKPYKRWKVILSKLIFIYIIITIYIITIFLSYYFIINVYKYYDFDISFLYEIIIQFIPVFFIGTLALFLSVLTSSTAVSVGISLLICLASNIVAQLLFGFGYNIFKYTFLPYIDFSIFKDNEYLLQMKNELGIILTLKSGIIIMVINTLFLILLSFNIFINKDIKN